MRPAITREALAEIREGLGGAAELAGLTDDEVLEISVMVSPRKTNEDRRRLADMLRGARRNGRHAAELIKCDAVRIFAKHERKELGLAESVIFESAFMAAHQARSYLLGRHLLGGRGRRS